MQFYGEHEDSTCLCSPLLALDMSNKSRSSSKRASKVSKQPGLLESFKRGEKKTAVVEEEGPTVIDLDDDDPVSENYGRYWYLVLAFLRMIRPE